MHPYLTRLGIRTEVQQFFAPFYRSDERGNLLFDYGDAAEHYGFAFHRIPVSENCWLAGSSEFNLVNRVFVCSSALEAMAFYHYKYPAWQQADRLLFLSLGSRPNPSQFRWITEKLAGKDFMLVFGNGPLDKAGELATAAALSKVPLDMAFTGDVVTIHFRLKVYTVPQAALSLNAFEKLSGYRFSVKTARAKNGDSYFTQLKSAAFND